MNCATLRFTFVSVLLQVVALLLFAGSGFAQETTAGIQGTVKDASGALVKDAQVTVSSTTLVGEKTVKTDASGYYRFANLPPGTYLVKVSAQGFATAKNEGLVLEVGHLPTLDFAMQLGKTETVVEVSGEAPAIDVTTNHTMTNITEDVIQDVPHGRSFQSVIQFAPSARNEPLEGNNTNSNGTGGAAPGSTTNGQPFGFSVGGASDAENSYLVEGQETANLIGGYSHTNVPFDFIQEVQIKTSGVEAEHGGALGGVVNVIMKKGTNAYHGSVFSSFENNALDGSPQAYSRYNPNSTITAPGGTLPDGATNTTNAYIDQASQGFQPQRYHTSDVMPGFTFGGPILKDRVFAFVAFNPELIDQERFVNYSAGGPGIGLPSVPVGGGRVPFSRNQQTYYTTGRLDAVLTQRIRLFGSWLYQYQKESGVNLPHGDSTTGLVNPSATNDPSAYAHSIGYTAPNQTLNFGADITLSQHLVSTTRFGYYFENYHDFGYPTSGTLNIWQTDGLALDGTTDNAGNPLPSQYQQVNGHFNDAYSSFYTRLNANSAIQFDQDVAYYKTGWLGTHNFKFGYQLNRLKNNILQSYNEPLVEMFVGSAQNGVSYSPSSSQGTANCANTTYAASCTGLYGYIDVSDFGTGGNVTSFNHGLFAQDSWTIGHGVTINAGVRVDKEYLPASTSSGLKTNPIDFSWTDKIAPRFGMAWDVLRNGKLKVFGDYGQFYDIMKLNLAISSFGGQYWNDCIYALDTPDLSSLRPAFSSTGRYCAGDVGSGANWAAGSTPAGLTFIENTNFRSFPTSCSTCSATSTGVVPGLKPYEQHESVFGVDYELAHNLAFEARWDRRRLDHVIEDSSIIASSGPNAGSETFVVGNPGQGVERTFNGFYSFLYPGSAPDCPVGGDTAVRGPCAVNPVQQMIPAARSYDGVEFRLTKTSSSHWAGMFSYTYSRLRGNYTGLTSSDVSDGQSGGRSAPNNSRAFDEPYFQYNSFGGSSSGLLPTDRPNTFKGYGYYELSWLKKFTTNFGLFQYLYSGSPETSYLDAGLGGGGWAVQAWDRGNWVNVTQDPTTGFITIGSPHTQRTPWFTQTDFSIQQNFKIGESKTLGFEVDAINLLNQRAVTAVNEDITSLAIGNQYITLNPAQSGTSPCAVGGTALAGTCYIGDGTPFYAAAERPYNVQNQLNNFKGQGTTAALNSAYGSPMYYQLSRNIRLGLRFTF